MTSILSFNSTTYVGANMGILKFEVTYFKYIWVFWQLSAFFGFLKDF